MHILPTSHACASASIGRAWAGFACSSTQSTATAEPFLILRHKNCYTIRTAPLYRLQARALLLLSRVGVSSLIERAHHARSTFGCIRVAGRSVVRVDDA